jgi:hypothetical protein
MFKKTLGAIVFLALSFTASAGLITTNYIADVNAVYRSSTVSVGDTVSWSVTFDEDSMSSHMYKDGLDGEASTADDQIDWINNCFPTNCQLRADAVYTNLNILPVLLQEIFDSSGTLRDITSQNRSDVYINTYGSEYYKFSADSVNFESYIFANSNFGSLSIQTYLDDGSISSKIVRFDNIRTENIDVPEPSTLAIFVLGMLGLASRKLKKTP